MIIAKNLKKKIKLYIVQIVPPDISQSTDFSIHLKCLRRKTTGSFAPPYTSAMMCWQRGQQMKVSQKNVIHNKLFLFIS
jgi:hypothetical protein